MTTSIIDYLLHEREYEWRKTTDASLSSMTVGRAREALRALEGQQAEIERLRADCDRLDWIERHLQVPAVMQQDDGTTKTVGAWALVSPAGLSLRETIDALMKEKAE